jgi:hypothetical protein
MNLISFDIGIKNMAYCIFQLNPGSPPSIVDWNVLNLMEEEAPKSCCECYLKAKNKKKANSRNHIEASFKTSSQI